MATSSKFDLSSDSPDRPLYAGGQRGSHSAAQLDRSGSFRENVESPVQSSLPNMARSSSVLAQEDVVNFFQCMRFDPKVVAAEHKSNRQGDFKRHLNIALGVSVDDSSSGPSKVKLPAPEEIKRARAGLRESSVKARERMKIFNEALSVFNKFFPSIPSKKRSRTDGISSDRPNGLLSNDRSVIGPSLSKVGMAYHAVGGAYELEQKAEERTKNVVPNKRTRTSLVDVRSNPSVRSCGAVDRDREMLRVSGSGSVQGEDRMLSTGDGWEKAKMKKKRSGIKADVSPSVGSGKPGDGYREIKQGIQQRPGAEARSRLNHDSSGFRPGVGNSTVNIGKSDGIAQSTGLSMRSSIPRVDAENNSPVSDRRERPVGSDKERVNVRGGNKANVRDDSNSSSPTPGTKLNASVRGPRSNSGVGPKLSPVISRVSAENDWEISHCSNKPPAAAGFNNRKRTASTRSSSPPVGHWAGQRPQKISRTARRTNLIPIVPNNDENPVLDTVSDVSGNEPGSGFAKRLTANCPQQVKLKNEPVTSAALSESEESGAPEIRSKYKGKRFHDIDEKAGKNIQKVSSLGLQSRKNKLISGEDVGDGVRRQGRSGRGFTNRSVKPMSVDKVGNIGTAKQLRNTKLGFEKTESKVGRPPTRKLSDRKAYARQKLTMVNSPADFLVGSDDGHEELLSAASAVINPALLCPNSFWKQMEPFFGFISDADMAYLKQHGDTESAASSPTRFSSYVNNYNAVPSGCGSTEDVGETGDISLCQRLLAAFISEDDLTFAYGDMESDTYEAAIELDEELGLNGLSQVDNLMFHGHTMSNGFKVTGRREHDEADIDAWSMPTTGIHLNASHFVNGLLVDKAMVRGMHCSELEYDSTQMTENLCLELQSIGIFPDLVMEDEEIGGEIKDLEEKYLGQVSKKKGLLNNLLKSASEVKELQEKEFEQRAYDKLVTMAYEKYMACRRSSGSGVKSSSHKMARQPALAFVRRTLERCHIYENTGTSCFGEPLFREMFLSGPSHLSGGIDAEPSKLYASGSSRSLEVRVSGSQDGYVTNSADLLPPVNYSFDQSTGKEGPWPNRLKKRELLLDDVGGTPDISNTPSGLGGSLTSNTKGKRSERDREGKVISRNGTNKIGRPSLSNAKGERKTKTKPKQKTQLSVSVNGLVGKPSEQPKPVIEAKSRETPSSSNRKEKDGFGLEGLDDPEAMDLSILGLDDEQGQDLGSWLNIDDEGLQDHDDFMGGLEIPMDDLSDLNMMV